MGLSSPLLPVNILVQQWHECLFSDGKWAKLQRVTWACPLLTGVTTAVIYLHPTVTLAHTVHTRCNRMNEVLFLTCTAQNSSVRVCVSYRGSQSGVRKCELDADVCKRVGAVSAGRVCVCVRACVCVCVCVSVCARERGPLVLSDRRIRSEGMYLSLSDSPHLISPPAQLLTQATLLDNSHRGVPGRKERWWP